MPETSSPDPEKIAVPLEILNMNAWRWRAEAFAKDHSLTLRKKSSFHRSTVAHSAARVFDHFRFRLPKYEILKDVARVTEYTVEISDIAKFVELFKTIKNPGNIHPEDRRIYTDVIQELLEKTADGSIWNVGIDGLQATSVAVTPLARLSFTGLIEKAGDPASIEAREAAAVYLTGLRRAPLHEIVEEVRIFDVYNSLDLDI